MKVMIVMASSAAQTKAIVTARLWALARLFLIRRALDVRVPNIVQPPGCRALLGVFLADVRLALIFQIIWRGSRPPLRSPFTL
jgi:hypothetical protein